MNKWTQTLTLFFFLLLSWGVQASNWYTVEVIIFANNDSQVLDDEYWPEIKEVPLKTAINLKLAAHSDAQIEAFQKLPSNLLGLNLELRKLNRSKDYRVLYHAGWMQPVAKTQKPKPIRIQGGNILDNGMYELDGYIGVGKGRYLHFRPDLYFSRNLSAAETTLLLKNADSSASTANANLSLAPQGTEEPLPSSAASATLNPVLNIPEILTVNLNQPRRMRSKELHFIDHPLFGILVEIQPVE